MNNSLTTQNQLKQDGLNQTLKVTSLAYLKEALSHEAYEQCAEILKAAKDVGVVQEEIQKAIQEHILFLKERDRKREFAR